jgi:hypothetical protein
MSRESRRRRAARRERAFGSLLEPCRGAYFAVRAPDDLPARVRAAVLAAAAAEAARASRGVTRDVTRDGARGVTRDGARGAGGSDGAPGDGAAGPPRRRARLLAAAGLAASLLLAAGAGWLQGRLERGAEGGGAPEDGLGPTPAAGEDASRASWPGFDDACPERRLEALLATSSLLPCPPPRVVEGWRVASSDPDERVRRTAAALLRLWGRARGGEGP